MSFLNPVSEPVKRFSSTDASAPQINYNARVAGDVKTVLKACLVTGYGTKASAGWSIVNEVDHVAEFVSPSAAMSDYRLGIDDTSTSSTTWYYQYQNVRTNPNGNIISKTISNMTKTSTDNGWELIVSDKGLFFIEKMQSSETALINCRITYWGRVKSALPDTNAINMSFWCVGFGSPIGIPYQFFRESSTSPAYHQVAGKTNLTFAAANMTLFAGDNVIDNLQSAVDIVSELYIGTKTQLVGQQPGILLSLPPDANSVIAGAYDVALDSRPILTVRLGRSVSGATNQINQSRIVLIRLDYWEY